MKPLHTIKFLILFFLLSSKAFAQIDTKEKVIVHKKYPAYSEKYYVIKKGVDKNKMHGAYSYISWGTKIQGQYNRGKKTGIWKIRERNTDYYKYYSDGRPDSLVYLQNDIKNVLTFSADESDTLTQIKTHKSGSRMEITGNTIRHYIGDKEITKLNPDLNVVQLKRADISSKIDSTFAERIPEFTAYYSNGSVLSTRVGSIEMSGQITYYGFYNNGDTAFVTRHNNGRLHGECIGYYSGKRKSYEAIFDNDRLISYNRYDLNGNPDSQFFVSGGNGWCRFGSHNDFSIYEIKNGYKYNTAFYFNNKSMAVGTFENGITMYESMGNKCQSLNDGDTSRFNFQLDDNYSQTFIIKADFKTGIMNLPNYIAQNINVPDEAIMQGSSGTALVFFIIEKDGSVSNVTNCLDRLGFGMDEASIEVVKRTSGLWMPATTAGFPLRMSYRVPIRFSLN
ncbi:MAG: hypothetical protein GC181_08005 [Bacteroidetes bacterium]|nr:hypothetical protein [Bacteroidota bacterium]